MDQFFSQSEVNRNGSKRAQQTSSKPYQERVPNSKFCITPRSNEYIGDFPTFWQYKNNSSIFAHPRRSHIPLNHVQYLSPNPLKDPTDHQQLVIKVFTFPSKDSNNELTKRQSYSSSPQQFVAQMLIEKP